MFRLLSLLYTGRAFGCEALILSLPYSVLCLVQVKEDVYEKIDKELLEFIEDVLLNRCVPLWLLMWLLCHRKHRRIFILSAGATHILAGKRLCSMRWQTLVSVV